MIPQHISQSGPLRAFIAATLFLLSFLPLNLFNASAASVDFSGNILPAIKVNQESSTGLSAVYVVSNAIGMTVSYTADSPSATVKWMRFSNLGGGYAQDVPFTRAGAVTSVTLGKDDMGYIVEENGKRTCFWVVNYANHVCSLGALNYSPEQDCFTVNLQFSGNADKITYYTINGAGRTLSRGINLEYSTQTFNSESGAYEVTPVEQDLESIGSEIHVTAPLCATDFYLTGDRFQLEWGSGKTIQTPTPYQPRNVEAHTSATQTSRSVDNEQRTQGTEGTLGGSAPVEITFEALVTEGVIFHEWQFSFDQEFDVIDMRVNDLECTRVFTEYGTVYVRFVAGDNSGECSYTSEVYTVNIGESRLECPNAFSPGSSEGVNDEWKVSYKSIINFDCHIYNRWGLEVAHLTDPSQGWDGRYKGKLVKSGVFFYVITADGADGKHYKLSGDINILRARNNNEQ